MFDASMLGANRAVSSCFLLRGRSKLACVALVDKEQACLAPFELACKVLCVVFGSTFGSTFDVSTFVTTFGVPTLEKALVDVVWVHTKVPKGVATLGGYLERCFVWRCIGVCAVKDLSVTFELTRCAGLCTLLTLLAQESLATSFVSRRHGVGTTTLVACVLGCKSCVHGS